jgi:hypothetical protein
MYQVDSHSTAPDIPSRAPATGFGEPCQTVLERLEKDAVTDPVDGQGGLVTVVQAKSPLHVIRCVRDTGWQAPRASGVMYAARGRRRLYVACHRPEQLKGAPDLRR